MLWGIALLFIFLQPTSGLLLVTALFVAIFLALKEVKRHRHSPWNPNLVWDKSLARGRRSWLSTPWNSCTKKVRGTLLLSDTLRLSCMLSKLLNRLERLFYPLTILRFNSKRSTKQVRKDYSTFQHFYGLACHAKHWISQEKLFWHFMFEPLYSTPSDNHKHRRITSLG